MSSHCGRSRLRKTGMDSERRKARKMDGPQAKGSREQNVDSLYLPLALLDIDSLPGISVSALVSLLRKKSKSPDSKVRIQTPAPDLSLRSSSVSLYEHLPLNISPRTLSQDISLTQRLSVFTFF